jgi:hypothetical protein
MLKTSIVLRMDGNWPVLHKNDGLAKNLEVAKWLFSYCGWRTKKSFPSLFWEIERQEWQEGDIIFPSNLTEFWVLGARMKMN